MLPVYTSISFNYKSNEIHIYTDAGRLTRPIYYIEDGKISFDRKNINELLRVKNLFKCFNLSTVCHKYNFN